MKKRKKQKKTAETIYGYRRQSHRERNRKTGY
jgi:hypothetical protein